MDDAITPTQPEPTQPDGYAETPELHERIDRIGFGLIGGATVMFFLGFVFAYFYLRSLDNNELWRPAGVEPPTGYGIAIAAALSISAVAFGYAARIARRGLGGWVAASGIALALGLFACVAQGVEYAHIPFGPESGGYASVFFGWTALYVVVALIALYRVETVFAAGLRKHGRADAVPEGFVAGAVYWALLAAIGVLAWIILYLV
jgi:heme/copper-type cytochrome/quinol oxidase subunit 3